jgi:PilZ domain-containing protein
MEHRRTRRFQLSLPVSVTRAGAERVDLAGYTKNISSSGVLFTTEAQPDLGGPIEYTIRLSNEGPNPVSLRCIGKVMRAERAHNGRPEHILYQIAATLERYEFVRAEKGLGAPG